MTKISILLVDDHEMIRQGMRALLACEPDLEVLAEAEDGRAALKWATKYQPDVVVMDLAMPHLNGAQATRQLLKACPATKVLVVSSYADNECIEAVLQAGAMGYLVKQTAAVELANGIREVRRGKSCFSPAIAKLIREKRMSQLDGEVSQELTSRETQVLELIADGFSNRRMATELNISIKTVEKHRQQLMNKLNIHETAGLTRFAISHGVLVENRPTGI